MPSLDKSNKSPAVLLGIKRRRTSRFTEKKIINGGSDVGNGNVEDSHSSLAVVSREDCDEYQESGSNALDFSSIAGNTEKASAEITVVDGTQTSEEIEINSLLQQEKLYPVSLWDISTEELLFLNEVEELSSSTKIDFLQHFESL
mmetsp:Transcript_6522/g.8111  ORF Transcript_6522/g.8111 Transcript_6522/m.8111 type:complete len:145 (+) Transcript_6522:446-880(+)